MSKTPETKDVYTFAEAAGYLRVSRPTLRDALDKGLLKGVKVGNGKSNQSAHWRISKSALDDYLARKAFEHQDAPTVKKHSGKKTIESERPADCYTLEEAARYLGLETYSKKRGCPDWLLDDMTAYAHTVAPDYKLMRFLIDAGEVKAGPGKWIHKNALDAYCMERAEIGREPLGDGNEL